MSEREGRKKLTFVYIFLVLLFSIGVTFLVLSIIIPPKNDSEMLDTTVNTTELEKKAEQESETSSDTLDISLSKNEVLDGKYQVRVTIFEVLTETGTCELTMKSENGDEVKRSTKTISAGPSTTSCDGFDIRTEGIASGTYSFTLTVTVGSRVGAVNGSIKI